MFKIFARLTLIVIKWKKYYFYFFNFHSFFLTIESEKKTHLQS